MRVGLINTNRIRPPIAPIGLEYVAEAINAAGHAPAILDLCWEDDWQEAIRRFVTSETPSVVGMTLRNTDDCMMSGGHSYIPEFRAMVQAVRSLTDAPVVAGGAGFSVMPEAVLDRSGAHYGIWGDGEFSFVELVDRLAAQTCLDDVPQLVRREGHIWRRGPTVYNELHRLPEMSRSWFDNTRYFREGGQAGFETRRGCPCGCTYCADPVAKGSQVRTRPPAAVGSEIAALLRHGIDHLHTCDSEFNIPPDYAMAVCAELQRRRLGDRCRWYAYCAPAPFPPALAQAMRAAGCAGINFGADSGDAAMLRRLGRWYSPDAIEHAVRTAREHGMVTMVDLLLGAPGETLQSLRRTIELMQRVAPERVGISLGVRIYPGTRLGERMLRGELDSGLTGGPEPEKPVYYLAPAVAHRGDDLLRDMIGGDQRFFYAAAAPDRDYNYTNNDILENAIARGYRGAYWDILRRLTGTDTV